MDRRYQIQTVSEITGVPTSTLRAWERRYGVPNPARTKSSYRMYGEIDVAAVRTMRDLITQGFNAGEAARLVSAGAEEVDPKARGQIDDQYGPAQVRILECTRAMDTNGLSREVRRALTLGSASTVATQVLGPALTLIGDDWHAGRIGVAHEHLATGVIETVVRDLLRHVQPARPFGHALLACFHGEIRALPMYMAAFQFTELGLGTWLLGANTAPDAVRTANASLCPDLIGLSVTLPPGGKHIASLLRGYGDAAGQTPWLVGGRGARALAAGVERNGGQVVGDLDLASSIRSALAQRSPLSTSRGR